MIGEFINFNFFFNSYASYKNFIIIVNILKDFFILKSIETSSKIIINFQGLENIVSRVECVDTYYIFGIMIILMY